MAIEDKDDKKNKPVDENDDITVDEEMDDEHLDEGGSGDLLKDMVSTLNELPTDVLQQLLDNLNAIDEYWKTHDFYADDKSGEQSDENSEDSDDTDNK